MNTATNFLFGNTGAMLLGEALSALHASTGVSGELVAKGAGNDGEMILHVAGIQLRYRCQVKRHIDRNSLIDDMTARSNADDNALLVSTVLSAAMAARCRELDLQFIDTAGNAYLTDRKGILINVVGRKLEKGSVVDSDKTITPAALRLMFAFLAQPSMLNAPYREISSSVQVATGAIGKALEAMETRGFIGKAPSGARIINAPERMLSEWATGYISRIKPKLKKFRFAAPDTTNLQHDWTPAMRQSAWSGEIAAEQVTQHLNPATATIYMDIEQTRDLPEMVKRHKLRGDPNGKIEVVQAFWNMDFFSENFPTVPLHLIYADLLETNDPRNLLIAKQIHKKVIDHVHGSGKQAA